MSEWQTGRLGELGEYINGRGFKKSEWKKDGIPIIRIQNLTGSKEKFNFFKGNVEEKHLVKNGDLLMSWAATLDVYLWSGPDAALNQHIFKILPKIDKNFLFYLLKTKINEIYTKTHGTGMVHITKDYFENIEVNYPKSAEEQQLIVQEIEKHFTRLDETIKNLKGLKGKLNVYRKAVLKASFHFNETKNLSKVSTIIMGQSPPSITYNKEKIGLPFFQGKKEFGRKYPSPNVWCSEPQRIAVKNDILMSVRAPVGALNIAYEKCCIGRGLCAIRPLNNLEWGYLWYYLKLKENEISFTGRGTTFNAVGKKDIHSFRIPIPYINDTQKSKEIQKKVVQEIESHLSIIDKVEEIVDNTLEKAELMRKSILKNAFEGKLIQVKI